MQVKWPDDDIDHGAQMRDVLADAKEDREEIKRLRAALKSCISWMPNCPARTEARTLLSDETIGAVIDVKIVMEPRAGVREAIEEYANGQLSYSELERQIFSMGYATTSLYEMVSHITPKGK